MCVCACWVETVRTFVIQGCILAPALFCVAIDWILQHMSVKHGIQVGASNFTDLVYSD